MPLPSVPLPTATVEVEGHTIPVRGLSRGEAIALKTAALAEVGEAEVEIRTLAHGLDTALEEIRDWYEKTPSHVVQKVADKIVELSGLDGALGNAPSGA